MVIICRDSCAVASTLLRNTWNLEILHHDTDFSLQMYAAGKNKLQITIPYPNLFDPFNQTEDNVSLTVLKQCTTFSEIRS